MSTWIVTGGAGFIGANFVRHALAHSDAHIVVLDKLTYAGHMDSLDEVADDPRFSFVRADIADARTVGQIFREHAPNAVLNFAAETHVDRSIDGPRAFIETNLIGTFTLLEAARVMVAQRPESERSGFRFLQVSEVLEGEFVSGRGQAERIIHRIRVGAMTPHRAIPFLQKGSLIITPGDREDMIVTICACAARPEGGPAGLVLSGGEVPHERILELLKDSQIPTFLAREDSFTVTRKIHDMHVRIQPTDDEKIQLAQQLVLNQVDLERILSAL